MHRPVGAALAVFVRAVERLESRVQALIGAGVDENEVRAVVRDAIDLGRGRG